jgi:hypothetical protein
MILIHYGDDRFRPDIFMPIKNLSFFVKPMGGLWASPEDSHFGWKHWCKTSNYCVNRLKDSFKFALDKKAKILTINSLEDLVKLPVQKSDLPYWKCLDFEEISKKYDAIYLTNRGLSKATDIFNPINLHGWDCESVLILKPNYIHEL